MKYSLKRSRKITRKVKAKKNMMVGGSKKRRSLNKHSKSRRRNLIRTRKVGGSGRSSPIGIEAMGRRGLGNLPPLPPLTHGEKRIKHCISKNGPNPNPGHTCPRCGYPHN